MPYRVDIAGGGEELVDGLVEAGALDVDLVGDGIAAILPDGVKWEEVAGRLGVGGKVSEAVGRDEGSVWVVRPRAVEVDGERIVLVDGGAFGTGQHATTVLCLEAIAEAVALGGMERMLDVGTGSGILALAGLRLGVERATGVDIEERAIAEAGENARLNGMEKRLELKRGGPEVVKGVWPLVVANVQAGVLEHIAATVVQRVGSRGRLILSGFWGTLAGEVSGVYRRFGMREVERKERGGWAAVVMEASW